MRKQIISAFLILFTVSAAFAQRAYTVTDLNDNEYPEDGTYVFDVHGTFSDPLEEAKLHIVLHNNSDENIRLFGQVISYTNTDGQSAQFCIIDACYFPLFEGQIYPVNGGIITPGGIQGLADYFINLDGENPLIEYKFRFFQGDVDTGEEIPGTTFNMTYVYDEDGAMGVSDVKSIAIAEVYPTVAKGSTTVNLKENASVQILNMEGKTVKTLNMNSGVSTLHMNGLSSGVYLVTFRGVSGTVTTVRLLVK